MTATANGAAHAIAHGWACAMSQTSVRAKISQSQSQARREPEPEPEPDRKTRVAGFTTSFSKSPCARRDVMVSATRLDEHTDLQAIEHLDFDPAIPCGCWDYDDLGERCPRTADVIVEDVPCPHCIGRSSRARWLCSDVCWTEMAELGTECATCGVIAPRDEALRLVGRLR